MPYSAAITAGGQIAASLLQKKPKERTPRDAIMSTVQGAREAGIHPLAALGAQPQFQQVGGGSSIGSTIAEGAAQVGSALARQPREDAATELTRASTEAQLAQAELFKAQSRTLISNAARAATSGPAAKGSGAPLWDARKQETAAPMRFFGYDFTPQEGDPSAERAQEWYGEPGEWMQAISSLLRSDVRPSPGSLDDKLQQAVKAWYNRNRGPASYGPMP